MLMSWKKIIGVVVGAGLGFAIGYLNRCSGSAG